MNLHLGEQLLERVSRYVGEVTGLDFPRARWNGLERALTLAAGELGFKGAGECAAWLLGCPPSKEVVELLASHLTVGETYFLREPRCLEVFEREIVPELLRSRGEGDRRLRIWSAGCATGEEPYTIAILLHRMKDLLKGCQVSIIATDINPAALRKARKGVYTEWSFRDPPHWLKEGYFRKAGENRYEILPHVREMVTFSYLNLVEDSYPQLCNNTNAMDVIFCRNVLMYLVPEEGRRVIERFSRCLLEGGWLIVSPCETSLPLSSHFGVVNYPDAILYRKQWPVAKRVEPPPLPEPITFCPPAPPAFSPPAAPRRERPPYPSRPPPQPAAVPCAMDEARALYEQGRYGLAAEKLEAHLVQNPGDAQATALLCRALANDGRLSVALAAADRALERDKINAGLHYLRAVILQEQGAGEEAHRELKRALYLDQEFVLAHFSLGKIALSEGREKESRRYFFNALSLLEKYPPEETVPESGGIPAERLAQIIRTMTGASRPAPGGAGGMTGS